ncbi:MAG: GNAT family N-acetyltransferase [Gammaproteobacteria bacterium]
MRTLTHTTLETIPAAAWNALSDGRDPFLRHEFLVALERHGCVGEQFGWLPQHLAAYDDHGTLVGAVPLYLKDNSYGEFVFDWAWADAYARSGLRYYPKLVSAIPYTPATGLRLLIAADADRRAVGDALIEAALERARELRVSSLHWLFTPEDQTDQLQTHGLLRRTGCQFHWHNHDYRDFNDFLDRFSSAKRKKVKQERRHVADAGIELQVLHGGEMTDSQWRVLHGFYCSTFARKSGVPTLSLPFFMEISRTMGDALVLIMAQHEQRYVAGAICLRGTDTLYGRHWGCSADYHSLHFEACYYQGIDYCIRHSLRRFEPGAQGEHKISRGFLPAPTWSAHWIAHPGFRNILARHTAQESEHMDEYMRELAQHSPYKDPPPAS